MEAAAVISQMPRSFVLPTPPFCNVWFLSPSHDFSLFFKVELQLYVFHKASSANFIHSSSFSFLWHCLHHSFSIFSAIFVLKQEIKVVNLQYLLFVRGSEFFKVDIMPCRKLPFHNVSLSFVKCLDHFYHYWK